MPGPFCWLFPYPWPFPSWLPVLHFPVTCPFCWSLLLLPMDPVFPRLLEMWQGRASLTKDVWLEKEDGHFFFFWCSSISGLGNLTDMFTSLRLYVEKFWLSTRAFLLHSKHHCMFLGQKNKLYVFVRLTLWRSSWTLDRPPYLITVAAFPYAWVLHLWNVKITFDRI